MQCRGTLAASWLTYCALVIFISMANCKPPFKYWKKNVNNVNDFKSVLQRERVKQSILSRLNMTNVTLKTLVLTKGKLKVLGASSPIHPQKTLMPNMSLVLSEATDPYKKDSMQFKLHTNLRTMLTHVQDVRFVLKLRFKPKRSFLSKQRKMKKLKSIDKDCSESSSEDTPPKNSSGRDKMMPKKRKCKNTPSKRDSRNSIKGKRKRGKRKRVRRLKPGQIKIIVRVLDPVKDRRRRVFVKTLLVRRTEVVSVPIPKHLVKAAAASPGHSVTVQVTCRNCKRYARMDRVFRKRKTNPNGSSNPILLNPNRPHLEVYTAFPASGNGANPGNIRSKRQLPRDNDCYNVNALGSVPDSSIECCGQSSYYSFDELGLSHFIVYPDGFNTVDCLGGCSDTPDTYSEHDTPSTPAKLSKQSRPGHQKCISTSTSHLDVLYLSDSNVIIPKRLMNVVSDSCGCAAMPGTG